MDLLVIVAIAFCTSVVAGTLGLGGAVLLIPAYLYLPPLLGIAPLGVKFISGMTSVQVLASSLFGAVLHRRRGAVNKRLVLIIGIPITIASLTGALLSGSVPPESIMVVFAVMAMCGAGLMLVKRAQDESVHADEVQFSVAGAITIAVAVGFFGGMVGAPGAFLLSPLMMTVLKIPTRVTIGSTLGIVLLSAMAASIGKVATGQVPYIPAFVAVAAAMPGAALGSSLSHRLQIRTLRRSLAVLIGGIGVEMLRRSFS